MINSLYKEVRVIAQMKEALEQQGVLLLPEFVDEKSYQDMLSRIRKTKGEKNYSPAKFSFSELNIKFDFLKSKELASFVRIVTGRQLSEDFELMKFSHKDFTLLHDDFVGKNGFDIYFFIMENEWDASWGGNLVYSGKDTKIITPQPNSLVIVKKKSDMQPFIKYINNFAKKEWIGIAKVHF